MSKAHLEQAEAVNKNATHPGAGAIQSLIEHLKEQKQYGLYQLCPKCNGQKKLSWPPNLAAGVESFSSSQTEWPCDICKGEGLLVRPEIKKEGSINEPYDQSGMTTNDWKKVDYESHEPSAETQIYADRQNIEQGLRIAELEQEIESLRKLLPKNYQKILNEHEESEDKL